MTTRLYPAVRTQIVSGGQPVISMYGPLESGGLVVNPMSAEDQGLPVAETLYVSLTGDAALVAGGGTAAVEPGGWFTVPPGNTTNVSVNAASAGHKFSAVGSSVFVPYEPPTGGFPPPGPVTLTKVIPSYLYQEYNDDDDLQSLVDAQNEQTQARVTYLATVGLPAYTGDMISGSLLDWIGAGLYGYPRPVLPSQKNRNLGPLNTYHPNQLGPNVILFANSQNVFATTDDIYKRCLTWHLYKGDGKIFTVKWLKRRVMRFLIGINGTDPNVGDTSRVSVTFGLDNQVNINVRSGARRITGGAFPNRCRPGAIAPNQLESVFTTYPSIPLAPVLKAGIDSGVLELPFQFTYVVNVL